jgi:hypothetical protein
MQNNNILEKEIKSNSNTVFMSEALDELLSEAPTSYSSSIVCGVKTNSNLIHFDLQSKETFESFSIVSFMSKIDSILMLEKEDITNIDLEFEKETLRSYSSDDYTFDLSWKQENNKYLVDIFINKRGD